MGKVTRAAHNYKGSTHMRIGLFVPCFIDAFFPEVGIATLELLWVRRSRSTTSHFRGPRGRRQDAHSCWWTTARSARLAMDEFWTSLKCIRCGACMNTCPVYRRSGGLSYGATYSGPIGLIIDPTFNARKYRNLPFASSLNGSCTNVCPVKINIHEQIYAWRRELVKQA